MSIVSTSYGRMRILEGDQVISRSLALYGEWAEDELTLLKQIISVGSWVLDVGAFIGTHTVAFSQFVGPAGRIYSFEPRREIYTLLLENISINNCKNVTALNLGLAESRQALRLSLMNVNGVANFGGRALDEYDSSDSEAYEIQISTIDDLDIERIDFIKIDVEGMERRVLDGSVKSISRHRPVIFCECNSLDAGKDLLEFCHQEQYKAYAFLASAFNASNFNGIEENIFGASKELALLMVPMDKLKYTLDKITLDRLLTVNTLEDMVLPLLHKPQYAYEVLANTAGSISLGINFPSPAVDRYVEEVIALKYEIARIKATISWKITKPLRFLWNVIVLGLKNKFSRP